MQSTYQSSLRCVCIYYIYLFSLPPKASAFKTSEVRLYLSFFLLPVVKVLKKGRERSKEKAGEEKHRREKEEKGGKKKEKKRKEFRLFDKANKQTKTVRRNQYSQGWGRNVLFY